MSERSTALAISLIDAVEAYTSNKKPVVVDGNSLDIASIVAVARSVYSVFAMIIIQLTIGVTLYQPFVETKTCKIRLLLLRK
jgi:hypothetical protein